MGGDTRVGEHIHQLLNLAHALVHATTTSAVGDTTVGETATTATAAAGGVVCGVQLGGLSDQELVGWAQDLEHLARFQQALNVQAAAEIAHRTSAGRYTALGTRGPKEMLVQSLQISTGEAARRLGLAEAILPTIDTITGTPTPPTQPVLGQAFLTGTIGQEQAIMVSKFVTDAQTLLHDGRISATTLHEVQSTLVTSGQNENPDFLRRIGTRVMSLLDPDGQQPGPAELRAKQGITFRQPRRGLVGFNGYLTLEQHETIMTIISRFTNPNHHKNINPTTTTNAGDTDTTAAADSAGLAGGVGRLQEQELTEQATLFEELAEFATLFTPTNPTPPDHSPTQSPAQSLGESPDDSSGASAPKASTQPPEPREPIDPSDPSGASGSLDPSGPGDAGWDPIWDDTGPLTPPEATTAPPTTTTNTGTGTTDGGVRVPPPGSEEMVAGLDPIDPNNTDPAVKDDRSYAQKLLDGVIDCLKLAARTDTLPLNGGLKAQLIITTRQEDLDRNDNQGLAFTVHHGPVPLTLFEQSLCDPDITRITLGTGQDILNAARTERLFTPAQRKLLLARDLGCTFPACTASALWCEAHHIIPWHQGGETNLNNAALLCSHHHTMIHTTDWTMELIHGTPHFTPHFTPPYLIDPTQTPRHNTYHHGLPTPTYPTTYNQGWNTQNNTNTTKQ
ncbi:HNH endonuclease [Arthrobacter alpinus]|uniref:HNH endonuclease n=1 Tax=Arthrobacter alpinus TaxID=656366 RepID=A0A1H5J424_9MICC|nr:HNH endonuclease [Arthrobacter alpinus]